MFHRLVLITLCLAASAFAAGPCCAITSIDNHTGIVTAKDNATGRTFQFSAPPAVLKSLRVGQAVDANQATKQVSVNGETPCCGILSLEPPHGNSLEPPHGDPTAKTAAAAVAAASPKPVEPGNGIEPSNGILTTKPAAAAVTAAKTVTKAPPNATKSDPKSQEHRFKAIWEPVNVKDDLELMSVHFISPEEGWVAGGRTATEGGVILHTKDAGVSWETQLGDPQSSDRPYTDLRFLNGSLGWAVQSTGIGDHTLFRTDDGQNWSPVGTVAQHRGDFRFTSRETGFVTAGNVILRTQDGGQTWLPAYQCSVGVEVNGLTRNMGCSFNKLDFVDANTGYAVSSGLEGGAGSVLAKTTNGGATWTTAVILPGENAGEGALHFIDPSVGVLRMLNGKMFRTADGGRTWTGVGMAPGGKPPVEFAGAQVGWMIHYQTMGYTTDGGMHWLSRDIQFPASVNAFSLVQPDSGYAAGEHGMVYRYRVVPIEYAVAGTLGAPAMVVK